MSKKLELTWIGKEDAIEVEPRLLIENPALSNTTKDPNTENMIIHGDNLLALKALEGKYAGKVKCIYIDPPYNIKAATPYYDDNLENSQWLQLMKPRIELLWKLLTSDGLLAVQIDDEQFARLFLLISEICGEKNLKIICVKMSEATGVKMASVNKAKSIAKLKEFIILAKKDGIKNLNVEKIPKEKWDDEYKLWIDGVSEEELTELKNILNNNEYSEKEIIRADEIAAKISYKNIQEILQQKNIENVEEFKYENAWRIMRDVAVTESVKKLADEKRDSIIGECFVVVTSRKKKYLMKQNYNSLSSQPRCKLLFADQYLTTHVGDLWTDIKTTGLDNEGYVEFPNSKKPEKLIKRILLMNTLNNDLVLDSFLGSGTTAAVAQKMGRRFIGIEMGEHAYSHCKVRLDKVIDGSDQGGISKSTNWQGGGGYRFYELAPTLIQKDEFEEEIINPEYDANMLASAVALHEGFTYQPDEEHFWKQSYGTENSYLFVTTRYVSKEYLSAIHLNMEETDYLIIACRSFEDGVEKQYSNITVKKIPQMLLDRCEFGKENYNLNIINPPVYDEEDNDEE